MLFYTDARQKVRSAMLMAALVRHRGHIHKQNAPIRYKGLYIVIDYNNIKPLFL